MTASRRDVGRRGLLLSEPDEENSKRPRCSANFERMLVSAHILGVPVEETLGTFAPVIVLAGGGIAYRVRSKARDAYLAVADRARRAGRRSAAA